MKKWKEALSKLEASTANAVNSAVRQIDKTLANDGPILPQQQQPERSPEPQQYLRCVDVANPPRLPRLPRKTPLPALSWMLTDPHATPFLSCRLPVESAKKLRWYDNADLAKMSVQHAREKHLLLDTITALKKVNTIRGCTHTQQAFSAAASNACRDVSHQHTTCRW